MNLTWTSNPHAAARQWQYVWLPKEGKPFAAETLLAVRMHVARKYRAATEHSQKGAETLLKAPLYRIDRTRQSEAIVERVHCSGMALHPPVEGKERDRVLRAVGLSPRPPLPLDADAPSSAPDSQEATT